MVKLAQVCHGRQNSFHLLRLLAAAAVLFSHCFALLTGDGKSEPLRTAFGCTPGSIAVDVFFLVSGLLVTISLVRRASAVDFAKARFFRIWPGLTVAVVLTVFVLGPVFTRLPLGDYLRATDTWRYLYRNVILLRGIDYNLPGVFESNPWAKAVNGSLWTLPVEVSCYLVLLASWLVLARVNIGIKFERLVAIAWVALLAWHAYGLATGTLEDSPGRLYFMFCTGSALYLLRDRIRLSWRVLAACVIATGLSAGHGWLFGVVYSLALPYAMLCLAYLPTGPILQFNRLGDYSYGTYIYAYPVQQSFVRLFPELTSMQLFAGSLAVTLAIAVISWHVIEKPALGLVKRRPAPRAQEAKLA
jgi:peptidoglycan/LPS O-acetylase OafA/YrhL